MLDRFTEARSHYRQSRYASQRAADVAGEARALVKLGRLNLDENRIEDAIIYGEAALAAFGRAQLDQYGTATALCVLATAHLRLCASSTAVSLAREAVHRFQEIGNDSCRLDALILLGRAYAAAGMPAEAAHTWAAAELIAPPSDGRGGIIRGLMADVEVAHPVPAPRTEGTVASQTLVGQEAPEEMS